MHPAAKKREQKPMYPKTMKFRSGLTLIEMTVSMSISAILVLTVGILLVGGQKAWQRTYNSAHKQIKQDAQAIMLSFGSMGRRANRLDYTIYNVNGGVFTPAVPHTANPQEVVSGNAVEFRYWDVEFDASDSQNLMNVTKTATAYALFYLDDTTLKVDYGAYPPRAIPAGGGSRNTSDITTMVLAENASADPDIGVFSHTTLNGIGQGSVRINVNLTDPDDDNKIKVMTATLMRNIWPR